MPTVNDSRDTSAVPLGTDSAPPISTEAIRPSAGSDSKTTRQVWIEARPEAIAIDLNRTAVLVIDMQNDFGPKGGLQTAPTRQRLTTQFQVFFGLHRKGGMQPVRLQEPSATLRICPMGRCFGH